MQSAGSTEGLSGSVVLKSTSVLLYNTAPTVMARSAFA